MVSMGEDGRESGSADFFAEVGVGGCEDEEADREGDEDEVVVHGVVSIAPSGPGA